MQLRELESRSLQYPCTEVVMFAYAPVAPAHRLGAAQNSHWQRAASACLASCRLEPCAAQCLRLEARQTQSRARQRGRALTHLVVHALVRPTISAWQLCAPGACLCLHAQRACHLFMADAAHIDHMDMRPAPLQALLLRCIDTTFAATPQTHKLWTPCSYRAQGGC